MLFSAHLLVIAVCLLQLPFQQAISQLTWWGYCQFLQDVFGLKPRAKAALLAGRSSSAGSIPWRRSASAERPWDARPSKQDTTASDDEE